MPAFSTAIVVLVTVVAEVIEPSFARTCEMCEDKSGNMMTRKIIKSDDSSQIVDKISHKRMKRESSNTATKSTTGRQLKGYHFQTDTKINTTTSFLTSKLVQKMIHGKRMFNATPKAQSSKVRQNVSVINRVIIKDITNRSIAQMNSKARNNVNKGSVPRERQILRRSPGNILTSGRNPCVKRIRKTFYGTVKRIFTEFVCRRASFYCSPRRGGLGRCMPLKTFFPSIDKALTTGCKCK